MKRMIGNITYQLFNDHTEVISCKENARTANIENKIGKLPVTVIRDSAFLNCEFLHHLLIPFSVTRIGKYAFAGCDSLTEVYIPSSVTEIGDRAFGWCKKLEKVWLCNSLHPEKLPKTMVRKYAFGCCPSLTTIVADTNVVLDKEVVLDSDTKVIPSSENIDATVYCIHCKNSVYAWHIVKKILHPYYEKLIADDGRAFLTSNFGKTMFVSPEDAIIALAKLRKKMLNVSDKLKPFISVDAKTFEAVTKPYIALDMDYNAELSKKAHTPIEIFK